MLNEKVVVLNDGEVFDQIQRYLYLAGRNSDKTSIAYERDIRRFFEVVRGKDIKYLTKEDAQVTYNDCIDFLYHLKDNEKLNEKTINRNFASVTQLLKFLAAQGIIKDVSFLQYTSNLRLKETENRYGSMSVQEVYKFADLALLEKEKGEIKNKLILFTFLTCIRLDAALNLKWSNFEETDTEVIVRYVDKGKKDFRPKISKKFFHELLRIKCNNENVFCISKNGVNRMMDRLRTKLDIQESRNIVFHSFRKAGAWYIYQKTGDIKLVQALLGHSNVATTDIYLQDAKEGIVADIPMSKDFDLETYRKVSHEELLDTIDKLPKNMKYLLAIALHKD